MMAGWPRRRSPRLSTLVRRRYDVRAELSGFSIETATVTVDANGTAGTTLHLRLSYTETVIVTARRFAQIVATAPATVTVIPSHEVRTRAGDDVGELFELIGTPGSAVWGANALSGVINIRTKPPADTLRGMASVGFGNVGVRHGRVRWRTRRGG